MIKQFRETHSTNFEDLLEDLNHPNPYINKNAFDSLKSYWPQESKSKLLANFESKNVKLRRNSIKALAYLGVETITSIKQLYLSRQEKLVRVSCLKALVIIVANNEIDDFLDDINEVIDLSLSDYSVEISLTLVCLLRQLGRRGIPRLIECANDKDMLRSSAAITAISEISDPQADLFMKQVLNQSNISKD